MIFDVAGQRTLQRVPMLEPLKGTEAGVGELVRNAPDAASLLRALAANGDPALALTRVRARVRARLGSQQVHL